MLDLRLVNESRGVYGKRYIARYHGHRGTNSLDGTTLKYRYSDVILSAMESQITGVSIVCSTVCWGAEEKQNHQNSASPVDSPLKGPVTRKIFPFDKSHHEVRPMNCAHGSSYVVFAVVSCRTISPISRKFTTLLLGTHTCPISVVKKYVPERPGGRNLIDFFVLGGFFFSHGYCTMDLLKYDHCEKKYVFWNPLHVRIATYESIQF